LSCPYKKGGKEAWLGVYSNGAFTMDKTMRCIICHKRISKGEGHYDTPHGLMCMNCHDLIAPADHRFVLGGGSQMAMPS
jgi:hypothetical protein